MPASSDDPVAKAEGKVAELDKDLTDVKKQLANLKKYVGKTDLGPDASWTVEKLTSDFPFEDFGVVWKKDEDTGRDPLGKLQARYEGLEKEKESLNNQLDNWTGVLNRREEKGPLTSDEICDLLDPTKQYGDDYGPLVGREKALEDLEKALKKKRRSGRSPVITTVASPGAGKTYLLRKGVLQSEEYKERAIMVTYNESAKIQYDPEVPLEVCFARQLVVGNLKDGAAIDIKRITSFDTVIDAFCKKLPATKKKPLIICVDELVKFRSHLSYLRTMSDGDALNVCRELRSTLMANQDKYTTERSKPKIRFVWTSLTELFEDELQITGSKRVIHKIQLPSLTLDEVKEVIGAELWTRVELKPRLKWALQMCAGNPRAVVDGFVANCTLANASHTGAVLLADKILSAISLKTAANSGELVQRFLPKVLTRTLSNKEKAYLLERGALHPMPNEVYCLNPCLVYMWAKDKAVQDWKDLLLPYFDTNSVSNPKSFEEQTLYFEMLLNKAYADTKGTPRVGDYFAGAVVDAKLRKKLVCPREETGLFEPVSLEDLGAEELCKKLTDGKTIYSQKKTERGIDSLVPLFLKDTKRSKKELHVMVGQNKLVSERINSIPRMVKRMTDATKNLFPEAQRTHVLVFTTHKQNIAGSREGVWFNSAATSKWLSVLAPPKIVFADEQSSPASLKGAKKGVLTRQDRPFSTCPSSRGPVLRPSIMHVKLYDRVAGSVLKRLLHCV